MPNTPKRKNLNSPSSPPKDSSKSAKKSPLPKITSPETKAIEKVFSKLSTAVTSPNRKKKALRHALNSAEHPTTRSMKAIQDAKLAQAKAQAERRAILSKAAKNLKIKVKTPFQLRDELKNKNKK